jgi:hypothetical protein
LQARGPQSSAAKEPETITPATEQCIPAAAAAHSVAIVPNLVYYPQGVENTTETNNKLKIRVLIIYNFLL